MLSYIKNKIIFFFFFPIFFLKLNSKKLKKQFFILSLGIKSLKKS